MNGDPGAMGRPGKTVSYNKFVSLEVQLCFMHRVYGDRPYPYPVCVLFQGLDGEKGEVGMKGEPGRIGLTGKIVRI